MQCPYIYPVSKICLGFTQAALALVTAQYVRGRAEFILEIQVKLLKLFFMTKRKRIVYYFFLELTF